MDNTAPNAANKAMPLGRKRFEWALWALLVGLVGVFLAFIHWAEVDAVNAVEQDRLGTLSKVIARRIGDNLAATNRTLAGVIADDLAARRPNGIPFNVSLRLSALMAATNGIDSMAMLDAKGIVVASTIPTAMGLDLSERPYFKNARDSSDKERLQVSAPLQSLRPERDQIMTVSRMVPGPKGEFAGLVVVALTPAYFTKVIALTMYSPDMWAYVVHGDGIQFADLPELPGADGTDLNVAGSLYSRHRATGQTDSIQTGTAIASGEQRVMALHTLQADSLHMDKPLVIGISRNLVAIDGPLQKQAVTYGVFYAIVVIFSSSVLIWMQKRRAQALGLFAERAQDHVLADERLKMALRGANLSLWHMDVATRMMTFDDHCFTTLGVAPQDKQDDPQYFLSRVLPEDLPAYEAAREACIVGTTPFFEYTFRIQHTAGHWLWFIARGQAVERDPQGQAISLMGTHLNFTELKEAEQEVRQGRNELLAVFDNLSEAIFVFDKHEKILRTNSIGKSMHGLFDTATPLAEVMPMIDILDAHGALLSPDQWPSRRAMRGDFIKDLELQIRRKDTGTFVYQENSTSPIFDEAGELLMFVVTARNITERKLQENLLRESESKLRQSYAELEQRVVERTNELVRQQEFTKTVTDAVPNMIGYWDRDLHCKFANKSYEKWFNVDASSIVGMHIRDVLGERLFQLNLPLMLAALEGEKQTFQRSTQRVDGTSGYMAASYLPDFSEGTVTGFFVLVEDITEIKTAENKLLSLNEALGIQVTVSTRASLAKTDFLANMSHEIRSPLNAILGLAYLLEQSSLNEDAYRMVRKIRASGRMLLSLISDILDMSKIEAGQMIVEQAPFRLADVMDNVAVALAVAVGEKDIEIVMSPLPAGLLTILGDALRVEQVLINLMSNAVKFTQVGSIQVRTELLGSVNSTAMLRFSVIDTGIGIAPELQAGVFSAFAQADTSTTRRFGGTGLGLTICRQLVSLMGGEVGVISAPGEGSEFWFTLPLLQVDDPRYSSPSMAAVSALIADDSIIALKAIADTAMALGWQVSTVDSGAEALAQVLERKNGRLPDVVVLDWQMPGMDGLAAARLIREGVAQNECPIVIMATSYSLTNLAAQPGADLVDAILHKPVTSSGLYNAVMEAKNRRAATAGVMPALMQAANDGLAGIRLLVVDDSDINREVAQRILVGQGASVTLAEDGQQAIDWLLAHPGEVDLVLMDVQMPVLDGIEATRRLRRMPQFDSLPIVALTAGAFKSQHDAAMVAGMTHFVSKPFDVPSTVALISRICRPLLPSSLQAPLPPDTNAQRVKADSPPTARVMDVSQGLTLWADTKTYQSYLQRFVNDYSDVDVVMQTHLARGERQSAAALAHKLSGVAANLALPNMRQASQALEQVLETQDDCAQALAQLGDALTAALAEIQRYAPTASNARDASATATIETLGISSEAQQALKPHLIQLLATLDSDNTTPIKASLATLAQHLPSDALSAIWACVLGYDFRGAEAHTKQLAIQLKIDLWE